MLRRLHQHRFWEQHTCVLVAFFLSDASSPARSGRAAAWLMTDQGERSGEVYSSIASPPDKSGAKPATRSAWRPWWTRQKPSWPSVFPRPEEYATGPRPLQTPMVCPLSPQHRSTRAQPLHVLALALAAACTSDDAPSFMAANVLFPPPSGAVEQADYAATLAAAYCSIEERCRVTSLVDGYHLGEPCLQYYSRRVADRYGVSERVTEGALRWDAGAVGKCIGKIGRGPCTSFGYGPPPCINGLHALEVGGPCVFHEECADEAGCFQGPGEETTCQLRRDEGELCHELRDCRAGQFCDTLTCSWTSEDAGCGECRRAKRRGEECDIDAYDCDVDLTCDLKPGYDHTGICQAAASFDEPVPGLARRDELCDTYLSSFDTCEAGTRCVPWRKAEYGAGVDGRCKSDVPDGERCLVGIGVSACASTSFCAGTSLERSICQPRLGEGEACDPETPEPGCALELICDRESATCRVAGRARLGERCTGHDDCYSGECQVREDLEATSGVCARLADRTF